jgi:hypothetical protein
MMGKDKTNAEDKSPEPTPASDDKWFDRSAISRDNEVHKTVDSFIDELQGGSSSKKEK